jgi:DNA-binding MarR family transcriptional regulator/GNAT superfamily N-acetyltransferase
MERIKAMTLRSLSIDDTKAMYQPCFARDFPPDELMPWAWMKRLIKSNRQEAVGFYDGEALAAYAVFITEQGVPAALLNYFAVEPDRRGQGTGSECLGLLRQALAAAGASLLFEVESPECAATPEDRTLRQRRVSFYRRCGAVDTGVDSVLFGVDYHIMLLPPAEEAAPVVDSEEIAAALEKLYRSAIPQGPEAEFTFEQVCQVRLRPESQEPGRFSRELGRALTFLFRGRKKFMGESLKEYDFTGAMHMILLHVDRHPGASQDSIANHMYLDKCTVARRTKRLEELGCLYRETDPLDRRQNKLYLTEKGRELAPVIRDYLAQWGNQTAASLTPEEKQELLRLLAKMTSGGTGA